MQRELNREGKREKHRGKNEKKRDKRKRRNEHHDVKAEVVAEISPEVEAEVVGKEVGLGAEAEGEDQDLAPGQGQDTPRNPGEGLGQGHALRRGQGGHAQGQDHALEGDVEAGHEAEGLVVVMRGLEVTKREDDPDRGQNPGVARVQRKRMV